MSGIDPRLIAWIGGSQGPQDAQEFRRRLAMLERTAGVGAQLVRADLQQDIDQAAAIAIDAQQDALGAQQDVATKQDEILHVSSSVYVSGSSTAPGYYNYRADFGRALRGGWAVSDLSGYPYNATHLASWCDGYNVGVNTVVSASGYLVMQFFGLPA